jgi:hypothetical protein
LKINLKKMNNKAAAPVDGYCFKMIGGSWVRSDQFPHLEPDKGTTEIWWPKDSADRIPKTSIEASIVSTMLAFLTLNQ